MVNPPRKRPAKLKLTQQQAAQQNVLQPYGALYETPRSRRVQMGRAFESSATGRRYNAEMQQLKRKSVDRKRLVSQLFPQAAPLNQQYQRLQEQIFQLQQRADSLRQFKSNFIRNEVIVAYPARNPAHSWMYV